MRVIAGSAGGLRLDCPSGIARPMMDRVRGAVFSSLGDAVPGARVADLFAGSGAIGIEALSRGAASCVFVDLNRKAGEVIRANLKTWPPFSRGPRRPRSIWSSPIRPLRSNQNTPPIPIN